jgi:hypothetical protein
MYSSNALALKLGPVDIAGTGAVVLVLVIVLAWLTASTPYVF